MKEWTRKPAPLRASLAVLLLAPSFARAQSTAPAAGGPVQVVGPFTAADVAAPLSASGKDPLGLKTSGGKASTGILSEGKPLEIMVWGGGGAVAGAMLGPFGAIVGAGAGALCGLIYSVFVVPHNGPGLHKAKS